MTTFSAEDHPHRRRNLLNGRWVVVSPHRGKRPWQGSTASVPSVEQPHFDPSCYLCPGNVRSGGERNPDYQGPYVFANDFPALLEDSPAPDGADPVFVAAPARGASRVICYSPDHSQTMAQMSVSDLRVLVDAWAEQSAELGAQFANVQIFENKGEMMGCSSPHPHGQIWASDFVPGEVADEDREQSAWLKARGRVLIDEVIEREIAAAERIVAINDHWLAVVPWWASWPFETLLAARSPAARIEDLMNEAREALAEILHDLTRCYDALFGVSFPYSMGWHQAPHGAVSSEAWRLHAHFNPPLLRSATIRKYMVGFEMFAESQRDLTPELAAARLRAACREANKS